MDPNWFSCNRALFFMVTDTDHYPSPLSAALRKPPQVQNLSEEAKRLIEQSLAEGRTPPLGFLRGVADDGQQVKFVWWSGREQDFGRVKHHVPGAVLVSLPHAENSVNKDEPVLLLLVPKDELMLKGVPAGSWVCVEGKKVTLLTREECAVKYAALS